MEKFLKIWIFLAFIALLIGVALLINEDQSAEDSSADVLEPPMLEMELTLDESKPIEDRNTFVADEIVEYKVKALLEEGSEYKTLNLKVQYDLEKLIPGISTEEGAIVPFEIVNPDDYPTVELNSCGEVDELGCFEIVLEKQTEILNEENILNLVFQVKPYVEGSTVISLLPEDNSSFNKDIHSFLTDPISLEEVEFNFSPNARKSIEIKSLACLGDFNNKRVGDVIVDLGDFSVFAKYYSFVVEESELNNQTVSLEGKNEVYDLINTDNLGILDLNDFAIFAKNYNKSSCEIFKE